MSSCHFLQRKEMSIINYVVYCQTARRTIIPWKIAAVGQPSLTVFWWKYSLHTSHQTGRFVQWPLWAPTATIKYDKAVHKCENNTTQWSLQLSDTGSRKQWNRRELISLYIYPQPTQPGEQRHWKPKLGSRDWKHTFNIHTFLSCIDHAVRSPRTKIWPRGTHPSTEAFPGMQATIL